jgi:ketosteroid isomerase-like protein
MTDEIKRIRKTVDAYFDAVVHRDINKILESWHPDSRMSFLNNGEPKSVPRSFWEEYCKHPKDPEEQTVCELVSLDITSDVALAKTKISRKTPQKNVEFTDYLTLLRQSGGNWLIMNKSYYSNVIQASSD